MRINLYDILSVVGKELTLEVQPKEIKGSFQGEELDISFESPFSVILKHVQKDTISVELHAKAFVTRSCGRCLGKVECDYPIDIQRVVNVAKKEAYTDNEGEYDEISYIEDCNLDVDMLVLDELFTLLPMNVLCKQDCKGICKVCGINLNKSTCNCDQTVPDPRMAVFSDIFNQFKEV